MYCKLCFVRLVSSADRERLVLDFCFSCFFFICWNRRCLLSVGMWIFVHQSGLNLTGKWKVKVHFCVVFEVEIEALPPFFFFFFFKNVFHVSGSCKHSAVCALNLYFVCSWSRTGHGLLKEHMGYIEACNLFRGHFIEMAYLQRLRLWTYVSWVVKQELSRVASVHLHSDAMLTIKHFHLESVTIPSASWQ